MSYPIRYSAAGTKIVETDPSGPLVEYIDYAILKAEFDEYRNAATIAADSVIDERNHLKAEVERLKSLCDNLGMGGKHTITAIVEENKNLKAEVERLKAEIADEKSANASVEGRLNSANRGLSMRNHLLQAEVERLRASSFVTAVPVEQYERVIKAGDKMANTLEKDEQRYNGCPSAEAEMWWIARDGGCP